MLPAVQFCTIFAGDFTVTKKCCSESAEDVGMCQFRQQTEAKDHASKSKLRTVTDIQSLNQSTVDYHNLHP